MFQSKFALKSNVKEAFWVYPLFLLISVLFLLVMSTTTSPLYSRIGGDSAMFIMMGRMFLKGYIPYVDIFDHKGPIVVFIEALGLSLYPSDDFVGVFILQVINLFIVLILLYRCSRFFLPPSLSFCAVIICLLFFSFSIQGGNLTEEYSLPFLLFSLLFTLQYYFSDRHVIHSAKFILLGVSLAILFWMRPTNMGVICACILFIMITMVKNTDWNGLKRLFGYTVIGFVAISGMIVIYFWYINALDEMIYASFLFNFKYMENSCFPGKDKSMLSHYVKVYASMIVFAVGIVVYYINYKNKDHGLILFALLLFAVNFVSTILIGPQFYHYMTLNIPCLLLGVIFIFLTIKDRFLKKKLGWLFTLVLSLILLSLMFYKKNAYSKIEDDSPFMDQVEVLVAKIPDNERNSIYGYELHSRFWTKLNLIPCYKYYTLQEWHGLYETKILDEINGMIKTDSPKWVIARNQGEKFKTINPCFYETLTLRYDLIKAMRDYSLYKLKKES